MPEEVQPLQVLKQIAEAIPPGVKENIIIVGSLAAAYGLFDNSELMGVRTKDADSVISPQIEAAGKGTVIAETLLNAHWKPKFTVDRPKPGTKDTEENELPALRLYPPDNQDWFLEFLTEPRSDSQTEREFQRFIVNGEDHYGLPSFAFMRVGTFEARQTAFGIRCALPQMMALANLLENPRIKPATVSDTEGKKRSNKDLGRVLAIARLSEERDEQEMERWPEQWYRALTQLFRERHNALASAAGAGLRELIGSPADLGEAVWFCNNGLLSNRPVTATELEASGRRALQLTDELAALPNK